MFYTSKGRKSIGCDTLEDEDGESLGIDFSHRVWNGRSWCTACRIYVLKRSICPIRTLWQVLKEMKYLDQCFLMQLCHVWENLSQLFFSQWTKRFSKTASIGKAMMLANELQPPSIGNLVISLSATNSPLHQDPSGAAPLRRSLAASCSHFTIISRWPQVRTLWKLVS